jgi:cytochrome c oxidase subunit 3
VSVFDKLTEKPWLTVQGTVEVFPARGAFSLPTLFMLLIIAYGSRMAFEDWRPAPQPGLLWLNTAMLIMSSIGMQWARVSARRGEIDGVSFGLLGGGLFAIAFLGGQLVAWRQLNMMTAFDITNPAIAFFYLITALHGLHLLGGLVAWARTTTKVWRGFKVARLRLSVELCAVYWHFLLLVWLVLFGLLFSGNDNLGILLSICGIR